MFCTTLYALRRIPIKARHAIYNTHEIPRVALPHRHRRTNVKTCSIPQFVSEREIHPTPTRAPEISAGKRTNWKTCASVQLNTKLRVTPTVPSWIEENNVVKSNLIKNAVTGDVKTPNVYRTDHTNRNVPGMRKKATWISNNKVHEKCVRKQFKFYKLSLTGWSEHLRPIEHLCPTFSTNLRCII